MKLALSAIVAVFLAAGTTAQTTNGVATAEIEGRQLAQEILEHTPDEDSSYSGTLEIRDRQGKRTEMPVRFQVLVKAGSPVWVSIYETTATNEETKLTVAHHPGSDPNEYRLRENGVEQKLSAGRLMVPFAGSDFWVADLGLEFLYWPDQKIIKHETRRTRVCTVLESTNPAPVPGAYSRVDSWIDDDTLALIWAEAYDTNNKLLKEFDPKKARKVKDRWELQDMEIQNVQTRSRTRIKFNLNNQ